MPAYPLTMLIVFATTLFTSATLLMMVQPIIGKMITPLLGGTPAVWNTCMVFFQTVLLAGYAYSHVTTKWLGVRKQSVLHLLILLTPFIFFLTNYSMAGKPLAVSRVVIGGGVNNPIPQLLLLLVMSVGVPFFVLSTSAPLLQRWFTSTTHPAAKDPYFLYAASNVGSMLALMSYPAIVEPLLAVRAQTWCFVAGYVLLVMLISAGCAAFLWLTPAKPELYLEQGKAREPDFAMAAATVGSDGIQTASAKAAIARGRDKKNKRGQRYDRGDGPDLGGLSLPQELTSEVTWLRRLRWVLLAAVPSSLMLGATTYMTTDIAAIPLLWVLPLTLYLLSFIIVFSKIPPVVHKIFVLLLPLITLLLIFMMLSEIAPKQIAYTIGIHLATLFVVAMVCHGELALSRPVTQHLTEYFLWMSLGGVLGGMFNGLLAPVIFNDLYEYQLAMVVACLLLPPLGLTTDSSWGAYADLGLAGLCLTVGSVLIGLRLWENSVYFANALDAPYYWLSAALILMASLALFAVFRIDDGRPWNGFADIVQPLGLTLGVVALNVLGLWAVYWLTPHSKTVSSQAGWMMYSLVLPLLLVGCAALNSSAMYFLFKTRSGDQRMQAWLDLLLPFAIMVLVVGLVWGSATGVLFPRLASFSNLLDQSPKQIRLILIYGLPAVLCYTFVERSLRFGLCVGGLILAAAFTFMFDDPTIFQERSFFGVLKVEYDSDEHAYRLVHGTTLHGMQFLPASKEAEERNPDLIGRDTWPQTYYHRTGPIGHVCEAYNAPDRNLGVIGLGTGTMACYAHKGQHVTFYDIDPVVRKITWESDKYFTFLKQARERGANMELVMGDARLTMERKQLDDKDKYHILIVDAFSSDAIPIHLITYEALLMYLDHMAEDGLVCFHVSNRHLNLKPVLANLADNYRKDGKGNLVAYFMEEDEEKRYPGKAASTWVVLARDRKYLKRLKLQDNWDRGLGLTNVDDAHPTIQWDMLKPTLQALGVTAYRLEPRWFEVPVEPTVGVWTDDYAPIIRVFLWQ